ncbi:MAG: type I restriction-modification system subunit M [Candidatus Methylumidiphilus sp.]
MNNELKKTLWATADKLRSNMDAAEYKHLVLGLVFLKYISDAFTEQRAELQQRFAKPDDEFFIDDPQDRRAALEDKDYYTQARVFWVPQQARWETLRALAKQTAIGVMIDDALAVIERENPRLRGVLDKRFARSQLEAGRLGELVDLVSQIGFNAGDHARDVLGEVYEYFLGQFANAEGKKGGQFYTPASVVNLLVEILQPTKGRVYDPCCGSGGMFVQSEKFVEAHGGRFGDISIYGQESNPTTWRLVAMNLAIRGMECDLGREPADSFHRDQHPDLRADTVLANPPFNISDWGGERLADDRRWVYGIPPAGNANYAWLQHILHHLAPQGRAGVVLANGSLTSDQSNEGVIRRAMVNADVVECIVALPTQLFFNTQVPACLWFLAKDKTRSNPARKGEVLFMDARKVGFMASRTRKEFSEADIARMGDVYRAWTNWRGYADEPGFCRSVALADIEAQGFALTPGRYVGTPETDDDALAFAERMGELAATLRQQIRDGAALDAVILKNLEVLGYGE